MDTSALVVPLSALSTTILGSSSRRINCATCCILSGFPTEVPPNFITFIKGSDPVRSQNQDCKDNGWLYTMLIAILGLLLMTGWKGHVKFVADLHKIFNNGIDKRNASSSPDGFHFPLRITGNKYCRLAFHGFRLPEARNPLVHMVFEIIRRPECIYPQHPKEMTDPFAGKVRRHWQKVHEGRHPGA